MSFHRVRLATRIALAAALFSHSGPARAAEPPAPIAELSLEQLMQVQVTTVSGLVQAQIASPAAVYVITSEDIRRAGHRSLAEALRMVPGMFVGRINASGYVLGARGLTGTTLTSTRYLVLVDGRVVYDPLFSGTFWDVVDVPLEDLDRIEVIRGPAATLWGANAMNGVINVITRSARESQGTLVTAGAGNAERAFASVRYGAETARGTAYRVWAKYDDHAAFKIEDAGSTHDDYSTLRGGFRVDGRSGPALQWTLSGEAYTFPTADAEVRLPVPGQHLQFEQRRTSDGISGGDLIFSAQSDASPEAGWRFQGYYDRTSRQTSRLGIQRDTVDVDFRSWARWRSRHEVVWGVQGDYTRDDLNDGPSFIFSPLQRSWGIVNAFVQDTLELAPKRLFAMVGTKLTYHDFVGLQLQPSVRLWWTPSSHQTIWAAVSRPVRVPSRLEEDGTVVLSYADTGLLTGHPSSGVIVPLGVSGDRDLGVEKMVAYELGHRIEVNDRWSLDTSIFYNDYSRLISVPPQIFGSFNEAGSGVTDGIEMSGSWHPTAAWRFEATYSWLDVKIFGPVLKFEQGGTPHALAQLRAHWDVRPDVDLDGVLYHVDRIPQQKIDAYDRVDLGLTWRIRSGLRVALWGRDLGTAGHREASGVVIPRNVYAQLTLGF